MQSVLNSSLDTSNINLIQRQSLTKEESLDYDDEKEYKLLKISQRKRKSFRGEYQIEINHDRARKHWKIIKDSLKILSITRLVKNLHKNLLYNAEIYVIKPNKFGIEKKGNFFITLKKQLYYFKPIWDIIISTAAIYFVIILPYRLGFNLPEKKYLIIETAFDFLFIIDAIYDFFYDNQIVFDIEKVLTIKIQDLLQFSNIFKLLLRIIISLPLQLVWSYYAYLEIGRLMELPRLYRTLDLTVGLIVMYFSGSSFIMETILVSTKLLISFLLVAHLFASISIAMAFSHFDTSWIPFYDNEGNKPDLNQADIYTQAFYFTIYTFATVGYANVEPIYRWTGEFIFIMIMQIVGIYFYTNIRIALINLEIRSKRVERLASNENEEILRWLFKINRNQNIKNLSEEWWDDAKQTILQKTQKENNDVFGGLFYARLPNQYKYILLTKMFYDYIISFHYLFNNISDDFIYEILIRLTTKSFNKGELLLRKGRLPHGIYFINKGSVYKKTNDTIIERYKEKDIILVDLVIKNKLSEFNYIVGDENRLQVWYLSTTNIQEIQEYDQTDWKNFEDNIFKRVNKEQKLNQLNDKKYDYKLLLKSDSHPSYENDAKQDKKKRKNTATLSEHSDLDAKFNINNSICHLPMASRESAITEPAMRPSKINIQESQMVHNRSIEYCNTSPMIKETKSINKSGENLEEVQDDPYLPSDRKGFIIANKLSQIIQNRQNSNSQVKEDTIEEENHHHPKDFEEKNIRRKTSEGKNLLEPRKTSNDTEPNHQKSNIKNLVTHESVHIELQKIDLTNSLHAKKGLDKILNQEEKSPNKDDLPERIKKKYLKREKVKRSDSTTVNLLNLDDKHDEENSILPFNQSRKLELSQAIKLNEKKIQNNKNSEEAHNKNNNSNSNGNNKETIQKFRSKRDSIKQLLTMSLVSMNSEANKNHKSNEYLNESFDFPVELGETDLSDMDNLREILKYIEIKLDFLISKMSSFESKIKFQIQNEIDLSSKNNKKNLNQFRITRFKVYFNFGEISK